MPNPDVPFDPRRERRSPRLAAAAGLLLVLCWALGGVTVDSTGADETLQLLALPVIGWAAWRLAQAPITRTLALALACAGAIMLVPLLQLLPLPQALGMAAAARTQVAADLVQAGVTPPGVQASLWPRATEQALWSLLPTLALFLAALGLSAPLRRRLLQLVLALALASAAFAFFQLSLPNGSPMLLYASGDRDFGGLFANRNHQGSALALGAVIALALFIDGRRRAREEEVGGHRHWLYAFCTLAFIAMIPLANGTAAVLLVLAGMAALLPLMGLLRRLAGGRGFLRLGAVSVAGAITIYSAFALLEVDVTRRIIATQTIEVGRQQAPLGSGVGSFVPVFAQSQDLRQARSRVINHAHNEYAQWWLEGGVASLLALGFVLGLFAWSGWQVLAWAGSRRLSAMAAPAWAGLLVLLLHSLVDFPLRTTALMATAGLLGGLLLATLNEAGREIRSRVHRDDALQQA